jgi:hypothetical protein
MLSEYITVLVLGIKLGRNRIWMHIHINEVYSLEFLSFLIEFLHLEPQVGRNESRLVNPLYFCPASMRDKVEILFNVEGYFKISSNFRNRHALQSAKCAVDFENSFIFQLNVYCRYIVIFSILRIW